MATGTHPRALYRLLRALAGLGVLAAQDNGCFALTPLAEPLRTGAPGSPTLTRGTDSPRTRSPGSILLLAGSVSPVGHAPSSGGDDHGVRGGGWPG